MTAGVEHASQPPVTISLWLLVPCRGKGAHMAKAEIDRCSLARPVSESGSGVGHHRVAGPHRHGDRVPASGCVGRTGPALPAHSPDGLRVLGSTTCQGRLEAARLVVEVAQVELHEGDEPDALVDLRHRHIVPCAIRSIWMRSRSHHTASRPTMQARARASSVRGPHPDSRPAGALRPWV